MYVEKKISMLSHIKMNGENFQDGTFGCTKFRACSVVSFMGFKISTDINTEKNVCF